MFYFFPFHFCVTAISLSNTVTIVNINTMLHFISYFMKFTLDSDKQIFQTKKYRQISLVQFLQYKYSQCRINETCPYTGISFSNNSREYRQLSCWCFRNYSDNNRYQRLLVIINFTYIGSKCKGRTLSH